MLRTLILLFPLLLLSACSDSIDADRDGEESDSLTTTQVVLDDVGPLIDPHKIEYFDFYNRSQDLPFEPEFFQEQQVFRFTIQQYNRNENPELKASDDPVTLVANREMQYWYDEAGQPETFRRISFIDGEAVDSVELNYNYVRDGLLQSIAVDQPDGDFVIQERHLENDRILRREDPNGLSLHSETDPQTGFRYDSYFRPGGNGYLEVFIPVNGLTGEQMEELHHQILERLNPHIPVGELTDFKEVFIIEENEAGDPLGITEFVAKGEIGAVTTYQYNGDSLPVVERYKERGRQGRSIETRYHYDDAGRLTKVVYNEQDPNAEDDLTFIHEFQYDDSGFWTRRLYSKKIGLGRTKLERMDVVTFD